MAVTYVPPFPLLYLSHMFISTYPLLYSFDIDSTEGLLSKDLFAVAKSLSIDLASMLLPY